MVVCLKHLEAHLHKTGGEIELYLDEVYDSTIADSIMEILKSQFWLLGDGHYNIDVKTEIREMAEVITTSSG